MSSRPPYSVSWHAAAFDDLVHLDSIDRKLTEAALCAIEDLAGHHKRGKELGDRNVSGDLSGLYRLKFDKPGRKPERFRIVYEMIASDRWE